jgi:hypothetical protein
MSDKSKMKCNTPKRTPSHPTKSHVVKACKDGEEKLIRFGQQGVKGAGKAPKTESEKARKASYYARHDAQDPSPDKMSARFWSHKVKWILLVSMLSGMEAISRASSMVTSRSTHSTTRRRSMPLPLS